MEELDYNKIKDILINSVIKSFKTINLDQTVGIIMSKDLESFILLSIIVHLKKENIITIVFHNVIY